MRKITQLILAVSFICMLSTCGVRAEDIGKGLYAYFLDVGQGDATVIICDGEVMMIDGGDVDHSRFVISFLQNTISVDTIDVMIATHPHSDHVGGLSAALNAYMVDVIYTPTPAYNKPIWKDVVASADKQGTTILQIEKGDQFQIGEAYVTILGPVFYSNDINNLSLVFRVDYGSTSFLFMGDAEWDEEHDLLDSGVDLDADILHVSHHGSRNGSGYRFLRAVMPSYGIISVGKGNEYGHPHEETLSRLRDAGVQVFRTDLLGTIMCFTDGTDIQFSEMNN